MNQKASPPQVVTAELRQWIVEQAQAGCDPKDVLAAMVTSGWQEDVAADAMEHTLSAHLAQVRASVAAAGLAGAPGAQVDTLRSLQPANSGPPLAAQQVGTGPGSAQQPAADTLPPASAVPEPELEGAPSVVELGKHKVHILSSFNHPRVLVLGGLLSHSECDELIALARPRLARSETVDNSTGGSEVNTARTSSGMFFSRGEAPLIKRIEQRIADLLKWPVDHGEGLQILHYSPGAEYRPHHDYFDPVHPGSVPILKRGGQRVATLVMYLNTPKGGGATVFPDVGLEVMPVRGNAVFFSYNRPHASTKTLHGGAPVVAGEKWVATKWLRQGVFV